MPDDDTTRQLRGEDFMNELDRRIQALTPEDMLIPQKKPLGLKKTSSGPIGFVRPS